MYRDTAGLAAGVLARYTSLTPTVTGTTPKMIELLHFLQRIVDVYVFIILASVIMSWLIGFGVINGYNPTVRAIYDALRTLTEPLMRPIRNILPDLGAIDISPIVLLFACFFVRDVVIPNIAKIAM